MVLFHSISNVVTCTVASLFTRQPEFGGWAFNLPRGQSCLDKWNKIPEGVDILMTHGPPLGITKLLYICSLSNSRNLEQNFLLILISEGWRYGSPCLFHPLHENSLHMELKTGLVEVCIF